MQTTTVGISLPEEMLEALDRIVETMDTDRSKYIRSLIREALKQSNNPTATLEPDHPEKPQKKSGKKEVSV